MKTLVFSMLSFITFFAALLQAITCCHPAIRRLPTVMAGKRIMTVGFVLIWIRCMDVLIFPDREYTSALIGLFAFFLVALGSIASNAERIFESLHYRKGQITNRRLNDS